MAQDGDDSVLLSNPFSAASCLSILRHKSVTIDARFEAMIAEKLLQEL